MSMLRIVLGIVGLVLIALPFLPINILPEGSLVGIGFLSNEILSIIVGALLIILAFWLWRRTRRRMLFGGPFTGNPPIRRAISDADLKRMQDAQRLRALQGA